MSKTGPGPLYVQVRETLIRRIAEGHWAPGERLPSEYELGDELGVSQGTVRKALDALAADFLVERRQGTGTYVTEKTPERSLFRYFRLTSEDGARLTPELLTETMARRAATTAEAADLVLGPLAEVYEILRVRAVDGRAATVERIVAPVALFPDLASRAPLPNALYSLYQRVYGVNITRAEDRLRAVEATEADAAMLGVAPAAPLLLAERVAYDLTDRPVERRESRFVSGEYGYSVTLR